MHVHLHVATDPAFVSTQSSAETLVRGILDLGVPWSVVLGSIMSYSYRRFRVRENDSSNLDWSFLGCNMVHSLALRHTANLWITLRRKLRGRNEWLAVFGQTLYGSSIDAEILSARLSFSIRSKHPVKVELSVQVYIKSSSRFSIPQ